MNPLSVSLLTPLTRAQAGLPGLGDGLLKNLVPGKFKLPKLGL